MDKEHDKKIIPLPIAILALLGVIAILVCCGLFLVMLLNFDSGSASSNDGPGKDDETSEPTVVKDEICGTAKECIEFVGGRGVTGCYSWDGEAFMEGEVRNNHPTRTIRGISIGFIAFDSSGRQIGSDSGFVDTRFLAPGQTTTFELSFDDPQERLNRCSWFIDFAFFDN